MIDLAIPPPWLERTKEMMEMGSADFYRRQSEEYARKAERAAAMEKILDLPVGSVIRVDRPLSRRTITYVALFVELDDALRGRPGVLAEPRRLWYVTSGPRGPEPMIPTAFVSWLINGNVEPDEILVVHTWRGLADAHRALVPGAAESK